jgi:hypothetical protein
MCSIVLAGLKNNIFQGKNLELSRLLDTHPSLPYTRLMKGRFLSIDSFAV